MAAETRGGRTHLAPQEALTVAPTAQIHSVQRGTTKAILGELTHLARPEDRTERHVVLTRLARHVATGNA